MSGIPSPAQVRENQPDFGWFFLFNLKEFAQIRLRDGRRSSILLRKLTEPINRTHFASHYPARKLAPKVKVSLLYYLSFYLPKFLD